MNSQPLVTCESAKMVLFTPVGKRDPEQYLLDGKPVSQHDFDSLISAARGASLPDAALDDERVLRLLLTALLVSGGAERLDRPSRGPGQAVSSPLPNWEDLRPEARNYLLLSIKREGEVSRTTCDACNLLNKADVVESYQVHGNRWTMRPDGRERHPELSKAKALEPASEAATTAEWLRQLGEVIDSPGSSRPWYTSKMVLAILGVALVFCVVHLILLVRVLAKVHSSDPAILMLPVMALGGAGMVGLVAVCIHKASGG